MDSIEHVKQQAANWLNAKYSNQSFDQSQFAAWYNADARHRIVYNDMEEDWHMIAQIDLDGGSEQDNNKTASSNKIIDFTRFKSSWFVTSSLAASFVLFAISFNLFNVSTNIKPSEFVSQLEIQQDIILNDNSIVDLNASSKIEVHFTKQQRLIKILKGDATFKVAKDNSRPFVVEYKNHKFTALGTAFTVNTRPKLQLIVTEHTVKLETPKASIVVNEGQGVEIQHSANIKPLDKVDIHLGWMNNELTFDAMPLSDVIAIIQPYLKEQIYLVNMGLADQPVSGRFELKDPLHILNLIAKGLNLKIKKRDNKLLII
ncbi:FecR family protein [Catenovulum sediminis]|uniref:FecR domain-containing protein n=1 Tax=Catenovulum sediminis TaxID=1740262 RepID=A0ABV1RFY7_9ALTE